MEVSLVNNSQYSASNAVEKDSTEKLNLSKEIDAALEQSAKQIEENVKPEKVMMDLKDVQNFLYMLIGSEIRIESKDPAVGSSVNTVA